jgi:hypothetical protein
MAGGLQGIQRLTARCWLLLLVHGKIIAEIETGDRSQRRASRCRCPDD